MEREKIFDAYRYQIVPKAGEIQLSLFAKSSLAEVIANKNKYFNESLMRVSDYNFPFDSVFDAKVNLGTGVILFRLGKKKNVKRFKKEKFVREELDSWPPTHVIFDVKPERQLLFVERNALAFRETRTVVKYIMRNVNRMLGKNDLLAQALPMFKKDDFWESVEEYSGRVRYVEFSLVTPNMSSITKTLSGQLKALAKNTLSAKTGLKIEAPQSGYLDLSPENEELGGLVDYSAEGGGEIAMKINGMRVPIRTSNYPITLAVDDVVLRANDVDELVKILDYFYGRNDR
ncbi:hypothetical protein RVX_R24070 [Nitratidesulfovibrio sp. HK-II]|uniref:hypothetical protein n=1 Tax=Nitratidesulfovibrio sp. HK-II TaxID=2009266 RepID=UPI0011C07E77|nr:hypothetical protein [Nitratidesulfovibrio sp. HK-II]